MEGIEKEYKGEEWIEEGEKWGYIKKEKEIDN